MLTYTHAGAGGELTLADLMAGLGGEGRKKLPATLRKQLERMAQGTKSQVSIHRTCMFDSLRLFQSAVHGSWQPVWVAVTADNRLQTLPG